MFILFDKSFLDGTNSNDLDFVLMFTDVSLR